MNLWIVHQKKEDSKHTSIPCKIIATSWWVPRLNHWQVTLPFRFNYSRVLPVNHRYVQRIRTTNPQSMNVGACCENYNFHYTSSVAIHVWLQIMPSAVVKKGIGTQRRTKEVHDARTVATVDGNKAPLRPKWHQMVKKGARSFGHCWVMLVWKHEAASQLVSPSVRPSVGRSVGQSENSIK